MASSHRMLGLAVLLAGCAGSTDQPAQADLSRVAFNCIDDDRGYFVHNTCFIQPDGTGLVRVDGSVVTLYGPTVSPSGRLIATVLVETTATHASTSYRILDPDGDTVATVHLDDVGTEPAWLDEQTLLMSSGDRVMAQPIDGGQAVVFDTPGPAKWSPDVSPDGRWITVAVLVDDDPQLAIIERDSGRARLVEGTTGAIDSAWSPDSTRFAVSDPEQSSIVIYRADDLAARQLTLDDPPQLTAASWSNDGTRLALSSEVVTIVDIDDGSSRTVTTPGRLALSNSPVWSDDDARLVVATSSIDGTGRTIELTVIDLDDESVHEVTADIDEIGAFGAVYPVWVAQSG